MTAVELCSVRAVHVRRPFQVSVHVSGRLEKKTPSFRLCQVDMYEDSPYLASSSPLSRVHPVKFVQPHHNLWKRKPRLKTGCI